MPIFDNVNNAVKNVTSGIDKNTAVSAAVGVAGLGVAAFAVRWAARKTGLSFLRTAANVATEGKK